ncbi:sulfonate ABC transporter substrate-binding protein [Bosea thiooxidans]|uniref:Putative aliphatic sulfonates-binding protein n=1 Tax=Bosea thiooxidans TaxID=53254 RepID=A0A0Q3KTW9_9HYPH|nr:aliphatic sulfonate ABC transporter substrate-binding protein [Bosea thiooxidans]KQK27900.1 sulfonate ABC transporter substrate-binding protein [Bosea thiooxidans]SKB71606.1 sulfonate transport system substrate-binding protein [Bosea thiooxidans]
MIDFTRRFALAAVAAAVFAAPAFAQAPKEIRLDYATYNPVSLVLKERGILEKVLEADGIKVRWVLSAGSNKALEFLNAGSIDFGSTAGAAALIGKINGNPIKSIYVYSRPEWTALVTGAKSEITKVADLKGKRVAVTRGTDPHIFLVRALADAKLTEKEVKLVLLQHADGRLALERGDVDAWAGLDPMMAAAEVESGARLFYRKPEDNTWGILNVREAFAKENPALVRKVIAAYEAARAHALANPAEVKKVLVEYTKLSEPVIERQLTRTELTHSAIGQAQIDGITAAGLALKEAGVLPATTDVKAAVDSLIDRGFVATN